jgi:hypothetical protein
MAIANRVADVMKCLDFSKCIKTILRGTNLRSLTTPAADAGRPAIPPNGATNLARTALGCNDGDVCLGGV